MGLIIRASFREEECMVMGSTFGDILDIGMRDIIGAI
jgi:hypothetical protein